MVAKISLVLAGSVVVLVQTLVQKYHDGKDFYWVWAAIISISSVIVSGLVLLSQCLGSDAMAQHMHLVAVILITVWIAGTSVMTVKAPYEHTGNGYFGAWLALSMSWLLATERFPTLKEPLDTLVSQGGWLVALLLLASATVCGQTVWNCIDSSDWCNGEAGWVLGCSGVSLLMTVFLVTPSCARSAQPVFRFIAVFFAAWWSAGFGVATFDYPYVHTGNGFFGCWVAFVTSLMLLESSWGLNAAKAADAIVGQLPRGLLVAFLASVIVLVAALYRRDRSSVWDWWAVICPAVSVGVTLVNLVLMFLGNSSVSNHMFRTSVFLFCWWIFGAGLMTSQGPFRVTSNGYFGAWIAVIASCTLCLSYSQGWSSFSERLGENGGAFVVILLCSMALLIQAVVDCVDGDVPCNGNWIWAIAVSFTSLVVCIFTACAYTKIQEWVKWIMLCLAILWGAGAGILTFEGPYVYTGNAYFASWAGFWASSYLLVQLFPQVAEKAGVANMSIPGPSVIGAVRM